jgi:Pentapeptide repeats (8 copies)
MRASDDRMFRISGFRSLVMTPTGNSEGLTALFRRAPATSPIVRPANEQLPASKSATAVPAKRPNRPDVQAAFTVITRRIVKRDIRPIDLTGAKLPGEDFIAVPLIGASLAGADLTGARMIGAHLAVADLRCANLTGADLVGAELNGANLTDAILLGTKGLDGAELTGASLGGAWWPAGTSVPEGWQQDITSGRLEAN